MKLVHYCLAVLVLVSLAFEPGRTGALVSGGMYMCMFIVRCLCHSNSLFYRGLLELHYLLLAMLSFASLGAFSSSWQFFLAAACPTAAIFLGKEGLRRRLNARAKKHS